MRIEAWVATKVFKVLCGYDSSGGKFKWRNVSLFFPYSAGTRFTITGTLVSDEVAPSYITPD